MKKRILFISMLFMFVAAINANVIIVNNNPDKAGQYDNVSMAITNANVGDTLYLVGSGTSYGNFTINKKLTIIGSGYYASEKNNSYSTQTGNITFDTTTNIISGCKIMGLYVYNSYIYVASGDDGKIHNVTFDRCNISYTINVSGDNWLIKNSMTGAIDFGYHNNIIVSNCFISGSLLYTNKSSCKILNCILLNGNYLSSYVSYLNFENNIFYNFDPTSTSNSVFNNNISFDDVARNLPPLNNTGENNKQNVDPKFTSAMPSINTSITRADYDLYDWHLSADSPGKNAGTDGSDIGIYGGAFPWPNFTGVTTLPYIHSIRILNPIVQTGDTVKVKVKAYKYD